MNNIFRRLAKITKSPQDHLLETQILWSLLFDHDAYSRAVADEEGLSNIRQIELTQVGKRRYKGILPDELVIHCAFKDPHSQELLFEWPDGSSWEPILLFDALPPVGSAKTLAKKQQRGVIRSALSLAAAPRHAPEEWHEYEVNLGMAFHLSGGYSRREVEVTLLCPDPETIPQAVELRFEQLDAKALKDSILIRSINDPEVRVEVCDRIDLDAQERELLSQVSGCPKRVSVIRTFFRVPSGVNSNQWSSLMAFGEMVASPLSLPGQATRVTKALDGTRIAIRQPNRFFEDGQGFLLTVGESDALVASAYELAKGMKGRLVRVLGPTDADDAIQMTGQKILRGVQSGRDTSLVGECEAPKVRYVSKVLTRVILDVLRRKKRESIETFDGFSDSLLADPNDGRLDGLAEVLPDGIPGFDLERWNAIRAYAQECLAEAMANGELNEKDFEALKLRMMDGLEWNTIADLLNCNRKSLRSRICRFLKRYGSRGDL